jgi:peroxiredoxin
MRKPENKWRQNFVISKHVSLLFNLYKPGFVVLILSCILFTSPGLLSQSVHIEGELMEYKGDTITFFTWADPFTKTELEIGRSVVDSKGHFRLDIKAEKTLAVHVHTGVYKGEMLVEPGKKYKIMFPPKEEKTILEYLNPYFEELQFYIGLEDTSMLELNNQIRELEQFTNYFVTQNQNRIASRKVAKHQVERFLHVTDSIFPDTDNEYFNQYKFYKLAQIRFIAEYMNVDKAAGELFSNRTVLYNSKAYMELFGQVFGNFVPFFVKSQGSTELIDWVERDQNYSQLKSSIEKQEYINQSSLSEMIIMKLLFDGFYADRFSAESVISLLDSLQTQTEHIEHKNIASILKKKVNHLLPGTMAPDFTLYNIDSSLISLSEFRGKYVYLNFCNNKSYTCQKDYELLKSLKKKFSRHLEIVTVSSDKDFKSFIKQMYNNECSWIFLHSGRIPEVLKTYRVRVYPSYYLIDPYGRILMAPAVSPSENFENEFHRVLNNRT